jgi:hypothetical protein
MEIEGGTVANWRAHRASKIFPAQSDLSRGALSPNSCIPTPNEKVRAAICSAV